MLSDILSERYEKRSGRACPIMCLKAYKTNARILFLGLYALASTEDMIMLEDKAANSQAPGLFSCLADSMG